MICVVLKRMRDESDQWLSKNVALIPSIFISTDETQITMAFISSPVGQISPDRIVLLVLSVLSADLLICGLH